MVVVVVVVEEVEKKKEGVERIGIIIRADIRVSLERRSRRDVTTPVICVHV